MSPLEQDLERAELVVALIDTPDAVELKVIKDRKGARRGVSIGDLERTIRDRVLELRREARAE